MTCVQAQTSEHLHDSKDGVSIARTRDPPSSTKPIEGRQTEFNLTSVPNFEFVPSSFLSGGASGITNIQQEARSCLEQLENIYQDAFHGSVPRYESYNYNWPEAESPLFEAFSLDFQPANRCQETYSGVSHHLDDATPSGFHWYGKLAYDSSSRIYSQDEPLNHGSPYVLSSRGYIPWSSPTELTPIEIRPGQRRILPSCPVCQKHASGYKLSCTSPRDKPPKIHHEIFRRALLEFMLQIQRLLEYLALLLQKIVQVLKSGKFAEFPNRQRPKCTTMPWTIWPSLVVLWGVCWMFHTPLTLLDEAIYQSLLADEQLMSFPGLRPPPFLPIPENSSSNLEIWNALNGEASAGSAASQGQIPSFLPRLGFRGQGPNVNRTSPSHLGSPRGTVAPMLGTPPVQSNIQPPANSGEEAGALGNRHMPGVLTTPLLTTAMAQNGPSLPTLLPGQAPFGSQNLQDLLGNADGKLMCNRPECGDKIFKWPSDLQTHMNKHTRPFRCPIRDCPRPKSGFATKGVLDRHMERVHGISRSTSATPLAVVVENVSADPEQGEMRPEVMLGSVVVRAKGKGRAKRILTSSSSVRESGDEEEEGTTLANSAKKAKMMEQRPNGSQQASQREEELVKENETLRQQLDRANEQSERYQQEREKERDVLLGIIAELQSKQGK